MRYLPPSAWHWSRIAAALTYAALLVLPMLSVWWATGPRP